jgi:hypothetical protein
MPWPDHGNWFGDILHGFADLHKRGQHNRAPLDSCDFARQELYPASFLFSYRFLE